MVGKLKDLESKEITFFRQFTESLRAIQSHRDIRDDNLANDLACPADLQQSLHVFVQAGTAAVAALALQARAVCMQVTIQGCIL